MSQIRILALFTLLLMFSSHTLARSTGSDEHHAVYRLIGSSEHREPPAETVEITTGPVEKRQGRDLFWWELKVNKTKSNSFRCQILSDGIPMFQGHSKPSLVAVYRLEETGHPPVEYVDAETGLALLPRFEFVKNFIPHSSEMARSVNRFMSAGMFLGHAITLQSTDEASMGLWFPIEAKRLVMNRNLLIGTSRTVRDDGRIPEKIADDYWYTPLKEKDYQDLIAAGFNLFLAGEGLMNELYDQPVFFIAAPWKAAYPELFYRSSYQGPSMYIDEPAVRCGGTLWKAEVRQLDAVPVFLRNYVASQINGAMERPRTLLEKQETALGTLDITDRDIASWDTVMETSFYQFATGVAGLVHENRAKLKEYNKSLSLYFGPGLEVTRNEMLYLQNAVMRGAARNFNKSWGTSIYGQMEEETRIPCALQAYDMGARYIWFWTSDHDHHVPYKDQLAITRAITDHARANPRPPVRELLKKATTVITIPNGYLMTLDDYLYPQGALWAISRFSLGNLNDAGIPYRNVLASAMWEGIQCLRQGEEFDFAIDTSEFNPEGYTRVVQVQEDGTVINGRKARRPGRLSLEVKEMAAQVREATEYKMHFSSIRPAIDGDFTEWRDAQWIALEQINSSTGSWPVDNSDLSARFAFAADRDCFYLAAEVRDDEHHPHQDYPRIAGDMIEVVLDPFNNQGERFRPDDLAIGLSLTKEGPYVWCSVPGFLGIPGEIQDATIMIIRSEDGHTRYEAALPLASLAPLDPLVCKRIGIDFAVMDVDAGKPERYTQWTPGLREGWRMPVKWGVIDWTPPEDVSALPLRAQIDMDQTAGVPGDGWKFKVKTAAWQGRNAVLKAEVSVDEKHATRYETPLHLAGNQEFEVTIPTDEIKPGCYKVNLEILEQGQSIYSREIPVYLIDKQSGRSGSD